MAAAHRGTATAKTPGRQRLKAPRSRRPATPPTPARQRSRAGDQAVAGVLLGEGVQRAEGADHTKQPADPVAGASEDHQRPHHRVGHSGERVRTAEVLQASSPLDKKATLVATSTMAVMAPLQASRLTPRADTGPPWVGAWPRPSRGPPRCRAYPHRGGPHGDCSTGRHGLVAPSGLWLAATASLPGDRLGIVTGTLVGRGGETAWYASMAAAIYRPGWSWGAAGAGCWHGSSLGLSMQASEG